MIAPGDTFGHWTVTQPARSSPSCLSVPLWGSPRLGNGDADRGQRAEFVRMCPTNPDREANAAA